MIAFSGVWSDDCNSFHRYGSLPIPRKKNSHASLALGIAQHVISIHPGDSSQTVCGRMPSIYGPKVRKKLEFAEGAACEDLRSMCPYFYTVAQILNSIIMEEEFGPFIMNTYRSRYKVHVMFPCVVPHRQRPHCPDVKGRTPRAVLCGKPF
jgi:hypothetical protein